MDGATVALTGLIRTLADVPPAADSAVRIDRIRVLEELKSAAAAAQARETAAFVAEQRAAQVAAGVPVERAERGVASQVGLARRVSPFHAQRYVGWSKILTSELPETFAQLQAGRVSEWRALLVARETIWLCREHRAHVDAELAPRLEHAKQATGWRAEIEAGETVITTPTGHRHRSRAPDPPGRQPESRKECELRKLLGAA